MPHDANTFAAEARARLGSVERGILDLLAADGGPVTRSSVVRSLYPSLRPDRSGVRCKGTGHDTADTQRTRVEATVSRAIASLARKGLIVRDRQRATGRTMLRTTRAEAPLPEWESVARDEEDFAVQAASRAEQWRTLAGRARHRALRIREERCLDTTGDERSMDVHMAERLRLDSTAKARREAMNTSPVSLSRRVLRLLRRDST